jgi:thiol-disulfide isomerase/thioredoxin
MSWRQALRGLAVLTAVLAASVTAATSAAELRPFVAGSMARVRAENAGKPHIVALWSLTCPPCHEELALLGKFLRTHPDTRLVLISTDAPEDAPALTDALHHHGLGHLEGWVFADAFEERLRYEIDPAWHGELPRTYLSDGARTLAVSGKLRREQLEKWRAGGGRP